ncbi:hypothetical protein D3P96_08220 [Weissella viridescens]|uniref:Uncharacterized protein n=1 Tax=Weissella viridescens TaxID=1629 RepID=A0A3P2R959_WEIVI|nr:hypothetical protein [Weissella viridescens]RRG17347.1 hypothetical protein D3P96_08220 [Weissella viridescens]
MSFTTNTTKLVLRNQSGQIYQFHYPFNASQIADWTNETHFEIIESQLPFRIKGSMTNFEALNRFVEALENSVLGQLTNRQIQNIIDGELDGWESIDENQLNEINIIHESNPAGLGLTYAAQTGLSDLDFISYLPGDNSFYIDWEKVGQTLLDSGDLIENGDVYVELNQ